jgi:hypothetical protein
VIWSLPLSPGKKSETITETVGMGKAGKSQPVFNPSAKRKDFSSVVASFLFYFAIRVK